MQKISLLCTFLAIASFVFAQNTEDINDIKKELTKPSVTSPVKVEVRKETQKKEFNTSAIQHMIDLKTQKKGLLILPEKSKATKKVPPAASTEE